jgi:hypothetical protein
MALATTECSNVLYTAPGEADADAALATQETKESPGRRRFRVREGERGARE